MKTNKINLGAIIVITAITTLIVVSIYNSITYGVYSSPW